ncbi:MAG: hypothetical protein RLZZ165_2018, partial [Bacteroidota bacterium]
MFIRPSPENDFFPSTLEHRPLHVPEKMELKKYFERSGADESEGYRPSPYAITRELADFEAWVWGLRFWGRECLVRGGIGAAQVLSEAWGHGLTLGLEDPVPLAVAHDRILSPAEAISTALYWANIPSEEKAVQVMEREKPLPEEWHLPTLRETLEGRPFYWGALMAWRLIAAILLKRDEAATGLAEACCGAARARMLAGHTPSQAVSEVKSCMV